MSYRADALRSSLTLAVPIILDRHYHSITMNNIESAWFVKTHKELLDSTFNKILMSMIEALFLDSFDYDQYLNLLEKEGWSKGFILQKYSVIILISYLK